LFLLITIVETMSVSGVRFGPKTFTFFAFGAKLEHFTINLLGGGFASYW
jgi:hypothetical protein